MHTTGKQLGRNLIVLSTRIIITGALGVATEVAYGDIQVKATKLIDKLNTKRGK